MKSQRNTVINFLVCVILSFALISCHEVRSKSVLINYASNSITTLDNDFVIDSVYILKPINNVLFSIKLEKGQIGKNSISYSDSIINGYKVDHYIDFSKIPCSEEYSIGIIIRKKGYNGTVTDRIAWGIDIIEEIQTVAGRVINPCSIGSDTLRTEEHKY